MTDAPRFSLFVVDDDTGLLRLIEKALTRSGYVISTANSGQAALEWLKDNQADLLLLDLKLKDIEGAQLVDQIAALRKSIPFIIITGQGDERVAVHMMKRGALDYLIKDASFLDFLPRVVGRAVEHIGKERKLAAAEFALRKEHEFVTALLRTSGALIMVLNSEGRIVRFNPTCERTTGYAFEDVKGKQPWNLFVPEADLPQIKKVYERLLAGDLLHHEQENLWLTRQGERRLITWSRAILSGLDGEVEHIICTGIDITERRRLEEEILKISEMEQQRLGRDLHDGLCQHLAGIEFMSQALEQRLATKARTEVQHAAEIAKLVRQAISDTRSLARGLSPVPDEADGLLMALRELADGTSKVFQIQCQFTCPEPVAVADNATATHLFRIAQEAVSNALRHGKATEIEIVLQSSPERINLMVHDNGVGFPRKSQERPGMGLRIMNYRAGITGGSITIQKRPAKGSTITCSLPRSATGHPQL